MRLKRHLAPLVLIVILPSQTMAGEIAVNGKSYFVDCANGNDSDGGTTPATRWRTLAKVNSTVKESGADVWLLENTVCNDQTLVVDWSGSVTDRVVVGTYRMAGGIPMAGFTSKRAEINGTYTPSCSPTLGGSGGCKFNDSAAVPSSQYTGLINVRASYVTVQDLSLRDSAGEGIRVERVSDSPLVGQSHVSLLNNVIDGAAGTGIVLNSATESLISGNSITHAAVAGNKADNLFGNHGAGLTVVATGATKGRNIIENNTIYYNWGEGASSRSTSYNIFRGNHIGQNVSAQLYLNNSGHNIIEYNDLWGGSPRSPYGAAGGNISIALEPFPAGEGQSSDNNLIRANVLAWTTYGVNFSVFTSCATQCGVLPLDAGFKIGAKIYGNTFVQYQKTGLYIPSNVTDAAVDSIDVQNNIFYSTVGDQPCSSPTLARFTKGHNLWTSNPTDSCDGEGDVYGDPLLAGSAWETKFFPNQPKLVDYALRSGSPARGAGMPLDATILRASDYGSLSQVTYPCSTFDLAGNAMDAVCMRRDATSPNLGAVEGAGTQTGFGYVLSVF